MTHPFAHRFASGLLLLLAPHTMLRIVFVAVQCRGGLIAHFIRGRAAFAPTFVLEDNVYYRYIHIPGIRIFPNFSSLNRKFILIMMREYEPDANPNR